MSGYGASSFSCLHPHRKTRLTRPTRRPLLTDSVPARATGVEALRPVRSCPPETPNLPDLPDATDSTATTNAAG